MKKILSIFLILVSLFGYVPSGFSIEINTDVENSQSNKRALVIGGTSGLGLTIALELKKQGYNIIIAGRHKPEDDLVKLSNQDLFIECDLNNEDLSFINNIEDIDVLIYSAGFGRVAPFSEISESEIKSSFNVNTVSAIRVIKKYYDKIASEKNFDCAVITSIAGDIVSPLFALYSATKSSLSRFIENINIELEAQNYNNRILNVSPGYIEGTNFYGSKSTDIDNLIPIAQNIINNMFAKKDKLIPHKKEIYENVIEEYKENPHEFGLKSYEYKLNSERPKSEHQTKVGYLCGTFDLFHIGHLNILRNAKKQCDYLVVGVHKDASHKGKETFIPLEERMEIVKNIKYVDECILATKEDSDAYDIVKYDYLFVGSDYKGSEKFKRYEEYFSDKDVKIVYLPYTTTTSSTQLRETISKAV